MLRAAAERREACGWAFPAVISGDPEIGPTARRARGAAYPHQRLSALCSPLSFIKAELGMVRRAKRRGEGERMTKPMKTEVTINKEAWARNLRRVDRDAPMDEDAFRRWRNNYFAFWVVCDTRACRRAKRCAGDPKSCHDRIWPHMPERMKFEFRVTLKAITEGLSLDEVRRKVKEELARFDARFREGERAAASDGRP